MAGICLSVLSDTKQVEELLAQDWVDSWQGWTELEADGSDNVAMASVSCGLLVLMRLSA